MNATPADRRPAPTPRPAADDEFDALLGSTADEEAEPDAEAEGGAEAGPAAAVAAAGAAADSGEGRSAAAAADDARLAAWIAAIAEHDETALTALYDATLSRVYGLVSRLVRDAACAEEVVEDTYFQVWRQAARFDPARGRAMTWLLGMARSRAIDAWRHEQRFRHELLDEEAAAETGSDALPVDQLLDAAAGHAALHRALLDLQSQPRQLVALAFFRGLSHEEIAEQTALPLGTVKSQIRRALLALRQILGDDGLHALAA